jgi:hypothetical protein
MDAKGNAAATLEPPHKTTLGLAHAEWCKRLLAPMHVSNIAVSRWLRTDTSCLVASSSSRHSMAIAPLETSYRPIESNSKGQTCPTACMHTSGSR